jgi:Pyruvate/2-oxoacid:ferredoxin oxidoreductase gamma subunit
MERFNIYLAGVGGQGIGLLSEIILRAADHAGHVVKAVDTHGLAQRGGIVVSQIRLGRYVHAPLIASNTADLVISLERHEALRALNHAAKDGGTLNILEGDESMRYATANIYVYVHHLNQRFYERVCRIVHFFSLTMGQMPFNFRIV